jgi:glyoxylase-like metal-dependent hydrolase (beta-lactamase superfamily II)
MTEEFFNAEEGFHNSVDFKQASETIRNIKEFADLVIPGHGNYFLNSTYMKMQWYRAQL